MFHFLAMCTYLCYVSEVNTHIYDVRDDTQSVTLVLIPAHESLKETKKNKDTLFFLMTKSRWKLKRFLDAVKLTEAESWKEQFIGGGTFNSVDSKQTLNGREARSKEGGTHASREMPP